MAELTLSDIFGSNSSQTTTQLTIEKSDLAAAGLTASSSNTAESLFAAILLVAKNSLTQASYETNLDQSVTVTDSFTPVSIVSRDDGTGTGTLTTERRNEYTVALHVAEGSAVDVNDY